MFRILKKAKSNKDGLDQKFEALRDIDHQTSNIGLYWKVLTNFRWLVTIVILVALRGTFATQLLLLLIVSILFQALHLSFSSVTLPFANEIFVSIYISLLMALAITDDIQAR